MARPGFMIHFDTVRPALRLLDDGQKGVFFQAMVDYAQFGQEPAFEGAMAGVWEFLHDSLDKDNTRYAEIVEKGAQAGKLGGQANASKCWKVKQMKATQANPSKPSQLQPQIKTYPHSSPEGRYGPQVGGTEGLTASGRPTPGRWRRLPPGKPGTSSVLTGRRRTGFWRRWSRTSGPASGSGMGQYIPYPATWLNQRRWEDEPEALPREEIYITAPQEDKPDVPRHWEPGMDVRAFID